VASRNSPVDLVDLGSTPPAMRATLLLSFLLGTLGVLAQAPSFQWAGTVPNVSTPGQFAYVNDVDVAPDGTAYVTGQVGGPRAIVGDTIVGGGYVARYDSLGNCLWARTSYGTRVSVNGADGAYVVGSFSGSMAFAGTTLTASGQDAFVAKYDANGQELWARQMGGALNDGAFSAWRWMGLGRVHVGGFLPGHGHLRWSTIARGHAGHHGFPRHLRCERQPPQWAVLAGGFESWTMELALSSTGWTCDAAGQHHTWPGQLRRHGDLRQHDHAPPPTAFDKLYLARFDASGNCSWVITPPVLTYGNEHQAGGRRLPFGQRVPVRRLLGGVSAVFGGTTLAQRNNVSRPIWTSSSRSSMRVAARNGRGALASFFFNDWPASLGRGRQLAMPGSAGSRSRSSAGPVRFTFTLVRARTVSCAVFDGAGTALMALRFVTTADVPCGTRWGLEGRPLPVGRFHGNAVFDPGQRGTNVFASRWIRWLGRITWPGTTLTWAIHWMRRLGLHGSASDAASSLTTVDRRGQRVRDRATSSRERPSSATTPCARRMGASAPLAEQARCERQAACGWTTPIRMQRAAGPEPGRSYPMLRS
jgi:hypothetical protein